MVLDLSGSINQVDEWLIKTDPNHIFYFSFLTNNEVDEYLLSSSLTVTIYSLQNVENLNFL